MEIQKLQSIVGRSAKVKALASLLINDSVKEVKLEGLVASAAPMYFASLAVKCAEALTRPYLFILDDEEQAGYFYHDLTQILGNQGVNFLPSSYRRAVKYGQRDAGNEILRTDALSAMQAGGSLFVVTYPEALAEMVVSKKQLQEHSIALKVGGVQDIKDLQKQLLDLGFRRTDYVYEPGQYAIRGSLVDVYSFSCEHPYRIDFFGDEIDSIRTFDVQSQLSVNRLSEARIVPELAVSNMGNKICILDFIPEGTRLVMHDRLFVCEEIERVWNEGFSLSAKIVDREENSSEDSLLEKEHILINPEDFKRKIVAFKSILLASSATGQANLAFDISPQPVFHKNFNLLTRELLNYQNEGYDIYILADSSKQTDRLESIFSDMQLGIRFTPINKTLHAGFIDKEQKRILFTDHQIFDRFHKYNLNSEHARKGKMALTLKEIQ